MVAFAERWPSPKRYVEWHEGARNLNRMENDLNAIKTAPLTAIQLACKHIPQILCHQCHFHAGRRFKYRGIVDSSGGVLPAKQCHPVRPHHCEQIESQTSDRSIRATCTPPASRSPPPARRGMRGPHAELTKSFASNTFGGGGGVARLSAQMLSEACGRAGRASHALTGTRRTHERTPTFRIACGRRAHSFEACR